MVNRWKSFKVPANKLMLKSLNEEGHNSDNSREYCLSFYIQPAKSLSAEESQTALFNTMLNFPFSILLSLWIDSRRDSIIHFLQWKPLVDFGSSPTGLRQQRWFLMWLYGPYETTLLELTGI